ncbi:MAG: hypothetical protein AAGN46_04530 [Acidobacteriota bacterium]
MSQERSNAGQEPSTGRRPIETQQTVPSSTPAVAASWRWPVVVLGLALIAALVWRETLVRGERAAEAIGRGAVDSVERVAEAFFTGDITERFLSSIPEIERAGGRLEVAAAEIIETFERTDARRAFWDAVPLGTTEVKIQVPVTYRYVVGLDDGWEITRRGTVCVVRAPELQPTLPPAIHTDRLFSEARASGLRGDAEEQLAQLQRSLTPRLSVRAASPGHKDLVRDEARRTIATFVRAWLLAEDAWREDLFHSVVVIFPDEEEPTEPLGAAISPPTVLDEGSPVGARGPDAGI